MIPYLDISWGDFVIWFAGIWLIVGCCIWILLDGMAVARMRHHSPTVFVLGALYAIVVWPKFIGALLGNPRFVYRALKRNLWGRS